MNFEQSCKLIMIIPFPTKNLRPGKLNKLSNVPWPLHVASGVPFDPKPLLLPLPPSGSTLGVPSFLGGGVTESLDDAVNPVLRSSAWFLSHYIYRRFSSDIGTFSVKGHELPPLLRTEVSRP